MKSNHTFLHMRANESLASSGTYYETCKTDVLHVNWHNRGEKINETVKLSFVDRRVSPKPFFLENPFTTNDVMWFTFCFPCKVGILSSKLFLGIPCHTFRFTYVYRMFQYYKLCYASLTCAFNVGTERCYSKREPLRYFAQIDFVYSQ